MLYLQTSIKKPFSLLKARMIEEQLHVIIMSRTRFRENLHYIVDETGAISKV